MDLAFHIRINKNIHFVSGETEELEESGRKKPTM